MTHKRTDIKKELQAIRALFAEGLQRTSRLEEELAPVQEPAPRKGKNSVQTAIDKHNKRLLKP